MEIALAQDLAEDELKLCSLFHQSSYSRSSNRLERGRQSKTLNPRQWNTDSKSISSSRFFTGSTGADAVVMRPLLDRFLLDDEEVVVVVEQIEVGLQHCCCDDDDGLPLSTNR